MFSALRQRLQPKPSPKPRVAIIGLDCAAPELVFEQWADELPNLARLRRTGVYGTLESIIPAITVPAWACMTSGKDPGTLGIYGFRNRKSYADSQLAVANNDSVREPRLWDLLGQAQKRSIVIGVPPSYPPYPIQGDLIGCFLTPDTQQTYTYPRELSTEIQQWVGDYLVDAKGFRTEDKAWLLTTIQQMTQQRFEVARQLLGNREWDFFMMVEIGVDRMHHGFWKDMDSSHRHHDPQSPYKNAIREYYHHIDAEIGTLLPYFDEHTHIFVVSDHGARKLEGGICLNEWLIEQGYLVLKSPPDTTHGPRKFEALDVDWNKTRAWGEGGYYGRVFINLQDREHTGIVSPQDYDVVRQEIMAGLLTIGDEQGQPLETRCFTPEQLYKMARGVPPDILVYFGDLAWRAIGTVGWQRLHIFENDTGPDDANHAQMGMLLYNDPQRDLGGQRLDHMHLLQIAPTVLRLMGLPVPADMQRSPIPIITV
jgi:predicted AlkP superfamily phosphohydrolase/phosphomutase